MMLPNGWKKVGLFDVVSIESMLVDPKKEPYSEMNLIAPDHIQSETGVVLALVPTKEQHAISGKYLVKEGDVIYSKIRPYLKKACRATEECLCSADMYPFTVSDQMDASYLLHMLLSETFTKYANTCSARTGIPKINREDLALFQFYLPPIEEQKKIAATLSVWDSAVEKMEKLIEAKESQKKSLITKLIVFSDDKNISELTKIKLSDIFDEVCEKNRPDEDVLTIIQGVGTVLRTDSGREIIYDKNSLSNYKYVKKGDFIIHLRSFESGLEVANQDGIVSPAYIILRPKIKVSTVYLYSLFHTNEFINRTIAPAVEGARDGRSVKYDVLKNQTITLPNLSEQQSVARLLLKADEELSLLKQQLENYKKQKQGLMQKLLTGQWRV